MRTLPSALFFSLFAAGCAEVVTAPSRAADAAPDDVTADDVAEEPAPPPGLVRALPITDVALFQAVRVPVFADGAVVAPRPLPIIAGRRAAVRVYVRPGDGYTPVSVDAELTVRNGAARSVVRDRKFIDRASRDEAPSSVFTFALPDEAVGPDARLSVRLLAPGGAAEVAGAEHPARFPADGGEHAIRAVDGGPVEVTLVPFRWDADGSGRLPDTSQLQVEDLRALLRAMYPVREVRVDIREPVPWTGGLLRDGNVDFGALLSRIRALRSSDAAPAGRYYYAMVAPAESRQDYCGGRCVLGQAYLPSGPMDARGRVASGVGFGGEGDVNTFAHEIGHSHGRMHAPCGGPAGIDPEFPNEEGEAGAWGYDERRRAFVSPRVFDFMGYCRPEWVSAYTYGALWDWILDVNGVVAPRGLGAPDVAGPPVPHRILRYGEGMAPEWLDALDERAVTEGDVTLRWLDAAGRVVQRAAAHADALADRDETHVLVPEGPPEARSLELTSRGVTRHIALPPRR